MKRRRRLAAPKEPGRVDLHVAAAIRRLRIARAKPLEWLAGRIGVSFQQIQKYENGRNRVSIGRLYDIAAALDVEPAAFLPHDGRRP